MEECARAVIWKKYKDLQISAFARLFPGANWGEWPVSKIVKEAGQLPRNLLITNLELGIKDLKLVINCRTLISTFYPPHTLKAESHEAFISALSDVVTNVHETIEERKLKVKCKTTLNREYRDQNLGEDDPPDRLADTRDAFSSTTAEIQHDAQDHLVDLSNSVIWGTDDTTARVDTMDSLDFQCFCDVISESLAQVYRIWEETVFNKGLEISIAAIESNIIYEDIIALLNATNQLCPRWFDNDGLPKQARTTLGRLDQAYEIVANIREMNNSDDSKFLKELCDRTLELPKQYATTIVVAFMVTLADIEAHKERKFNLFKASILASTLLRFRERCTKPYVDVTREVVVAECDHLLSIIDPGKLSNATEFRALIEKIRHQAEVSLDIWTFGHLSAFVYGNLQVYFRTELGYPLIPTLAHVYVYYTLTGNPMVPQLENLCKNFDKLLFWNGRPEEIQDCKDSWMKWASPYSADSARRAAEISKRRQGRQPLLVELMNGDLSITSDTKRDLSSVLKQDLLSYPDFSELSTAIYYAAGVDQMTKDSEALASLRMGITFLYKEKDATEFMRKFLSKYQRSV